ncbi:NAD(P)-binding protein [Coniophora puteana RWD-64-598 SS2]|uniref:NAD(P)-binding protein n=1 Tax=Coniophora puteana (strain RWD-64-598) TaxID=741705 RepID=A0A5M3N0R3_CONPW|nr:NAD(P)-binding protein [Coniophora puteana RWD-64-598 SS2]EIW84972.1 NAD(P)-binding protein [Coniophora puteana RWD-64-598 SS2]
MALQIPSQQQSWRVLNKGLPSDPNVLTLQSDTDVPRKLCKGEILVKVQAAALNPVGWKMMGFLPNFVARRPLTPEHDFAGTVVDPNGSEYSVGDEVFGWIPFPLQLSSHQGTLAQYTRLPAANVIRKPSNLTFVEAAAVPLVSLTAYQGLVHDAKLKSGQTVLINGGSTSVGIVAIQIAKWIGANIVVSASHRNEEFVRSLGVDEVVDYTKKPLAQHFTENPPSPKFDIIFDAVGLTDQSLYRESEAYLKPEGAFVSTGPVLGGLPSMILQSIRPSWLGGTKRTWKLVGVEQNVADFKKIQELLVTGDLKPVVDTVFSFNDVLNAYERIMTNRARGKVVVTMEDI